MILVGETTACACGHDVTLHDTFGCAAFLGAFAETAATKSYCACKRAHGDSASKGVLARADDIVARVRIRERRGAAIGVCEFPPALELGSNAEQVMARVKLRLLDAVEPSPNGAPQFLLIEREGVRDRRIVPLR